MNDMYCIIHEGWADPKFVELGDPCGICILTTCPPPTLPENWIDVVSEPSPNEWFTMQSNASHLLNDVLDAEVDVE